MDYPIRSMIDGQPTFDQPLQEILTECKPGGALRILDPLEYHTERQRRWYKGICLRGLSEWNGETTGDWDLRLKAYCNGNELLKKEPIYLGSGVVVTRLTIKEVGKRNMTAFIQNILSESLKNDWPVTPPDTDLRV